MKIRSDTMDPESCKKYLPHGLMPLLFEDPANVNVGKLLQFYLDSFRNDDLWQPHFHAKVFRAVAASYVLSGACLIRREIDECKALILNSGFLQDCSRKSAVKRMMAATISPSMSPGEVQRELRPILVNYYYNLDLITQYDTCFSQLAIAGFLAEIIPNKAAWIESTKHSNLYNDLFFQSHGEGTIRWVTLNIVDIDADSKYEIYFPNNYELDALLRMYCADSNISTKQFRLACNGRRIFMSSSGKKKLYDLGIHESCVIELSAITPAEDVDSENSIPNLKAVSASKQQRCATSKSKSKSSKMNKVKKKPKPGSNDVEKRQDSDERDYREEHGQKMTYVFYEACEKFKAIRKKIDAEMIEKTPPKLKKRPPKPSPRDRNGSHRAETEQVNWLSDGSLGGKAGKPIYPILVGDKEKLYKSSKKRTCVPVHESLDLHGCSKKEALARLDEKLPIWTNKAMKGGDPFTISVDIICGGGNQVLSEVVGQWIRNNGQVANRPKNFM